jgi:DNA modification methylase
VPELVEAYRTPLGSMWNGDSLDLLALLPDDRVDLILTSPPFALTREKGYGNHPEDEYVAWFESFAEQFHRVLKDTGSLVIDLGGAWLPGSPTRSLYQYRLLLNLVDKFEFHLAEDFYWFNRAKLPGPRQWATIDRVRVKDAVNNVWWLSKTPHPKADNRKVLKPYSKSMLRMIERGTYNEGARPSEHVIGKNWAQDLGGAIPPNVIELDAEEEAERLRTRYPEPDNMLDYANTTSSDPYHRFCKDNGFKRHPARFPREVPEFFIKFLTDRGDLVLDPFGGSNVTGAVAEELERVWWSCELDMDYIVGSVGRFSKASVTPNDPQLKKVIAALDFPDEVEP